MSTASTHVVFSAHDLVVLERRLGRSAEADKLLARAPEIRANAQRYQARLPEMEREIAASLEKEKQLANRGERADVLANSRQRVALIRERYGDGSPEMASNLQLIALQLESLGRYLEAEPLYLRALEILEKTNGEASPAVLLLQSTLGRLRKTLGHGGEDDGQRLLNLIVSLQQKHGEETVEIWFPCNSSRSITVIPSARKKKRSPHIGADLRSPRRHTAQFTS
jgi:tetratricopeptide (TPR) repeat protein